MFFFKTTFQVLPDLKGERFALKGEKNFHVQTSPDKFNASEAALRNNAHILSELKTHPQKEKRLFGDLKNGLLETMQ